MLRCCHPLLALFLLASPLVTKAADDDFVEVQQLEPSIQVELAYATEDNFCKVQLYPVARCFARRKVAEALIAAHKSLAQYGLGIKVWDIYRPHSVQYRMWEKAPFPGYVGDPKVGSKHNRGTATDVTLYDLQTGQELEMPTPFDEFSKRAAADYPNLPAQVLANRRILQEAMHAQGFETIPTEWWHFDYRDWAKFPLSDEPLTVLAARADEAARLAAESDSNWPRFRGPDGSGIVSEGGVPLSWSAEENMKWKLDLPGPGSSSPIVWNGKVFVTCYSGYGAGDANAKLSDLVRHLLCIDLHTGQILWSADEPTLGKEDPYEGYLPEHGYASSTPTTDGERIYCFYGKNGVYAYDFSGKRLWSAPTGTGSSKLVWGSAGSPVLYSGLLYVNAGDEAHALLALDAETGQEKWRMEHPMIEQTYSTPAIQVLSPTRTDLIVALRGELRALDPITGAVRWFSKSPADGNLSSSPVAISDGRIVMVGGFPQIMGTVFLGGGEGDRSETALLWQSQKAKSYMPLPVENGDLLQWVNEDGIAICVKRDTGEILYRERLDISQSTNKGWPFYASPILVDDHIIAVSRTAGAFVIAAGPEFKLFGVNRIEGDSTRFHATPAVSEGILLLRSEKTLYAISR